MGRIRITLSVKIAGLVLLVVLFFGGYVLLTSVQFGKIADTIAHSVETVVSGQEEGGRLLARVEASAAFDRRVVEALVAQLTLGHMDKLYLATEDSMLVLEHEEILDRLDASIGELGGSSPAIAALSAPLAEYRTYFQTVDALISGRDLDKARQVSVTAVDASSKAIVSGLQAVLAQSSTQTAETLRAARDASDAAVASVGELQRGASGMEASLRALLGISLVLIAVSLALAVLLPRYVVKALRQVIGALETVASGDFTQNIRVRGHDEVGELGSQLNRMMEQLRGMLREISTVSVDLAAISEELSTTTAQIASSNEEVGGQAQAVASSTTEMSATVEQVARSAASVSRSSEDARTVAVEGGGVIGEALGAFDQIQKAVGSAAQIVTKLGRQGETIGSVVEVIEDIADQTNLLALNAAIEAARAGEHGRGFAVVADEVRKLAEKTVKATQEIARTVKAIQDDSREAIRAMETGEASVAGGADRAKTAGRSVQQIESRIAATSDQVSQMATASEQLSATIRNMAHNVDEIAHGVTQTVTAVNEVSNTAQTVAARADSLREAVGRFRI
ncbi:MAG: methyl-accepting chemotaxis protein [Thermodesulfobacteriota bacterium]